MNENPILSGKPTGEKIAVAHCWLCGEPAGFADTYRTEGGGISTGPIMVGHGPHLCEVCKKAILKAIGREKKCLTGS